MPNIRTANGWDNNRPNDGTTSDINACAQWCRQNNPSNISAGYVKSNKSCFCKRIAGLEGVDNNWDTAIFI
jgi:hypothetical protein